jgi:predicted transcriptional regulator of viral defense system
MGAVDADRAIAQLAESQHGLITRQQALGLGLSSRALQGRLNGGRWERVLRGVFRIAGSENAYEQRIMAATLAGGPGAIASHRSAAALYGTPGVPRWLEITVPPPRRAVVDGVVVHQLAVLAETSTACEASP